MTASTTSPAFTLDIDADGIGLVTIDMPGRAMNVLNETLTAPFAELVTRLETDAALKGLVITSGKSTFIVGADIDLWEINEAFATVPMKTARDLGVPMERVNVNGGAIAMGHPLGATGAIILGTALDELERTGQSTALATLCIGAGMGIATIIERV